MHSDKVTVTLSKIDQITVTCEVTASDRLVFEDDGYLTGVFTLYEAGKCGQIAVRVGTVRALIEELSKWADQVDPENTADI